MPPNVLFDNEILPSINEDNWSLPLLISLADLSAITKVDKDSVFGHLRFDEARDALTRRYEDIKEWMVYEGDGYGSYNEGIDADNVEIVIEKISGRTQSAAAVEAEMNKTMITGYDRVARRTPGGRLMGGQPRLSVAAGPIPSNNQLTPASPPADSSPVSPVIKTPESSSTASSLRYESAMPASGQCSDDNNSNGRQGGRAGWALRAHDPWSLVRVVAPRLQSPYQPMTSPVFGRPNPAPAPMSPVHDAPESPNFGPMQPPHGPNNMLDSPLHHYQDVEQSGGLPTRASQLLVPALAEPMNPAPLPQIQCRVPASLARMRQLREARQQQTGAVPTSPVNTSSSGSDSPAPSVDPLAGLLASSEPYSPTTPTRQAALPAPPPPRVASPNRSAAPSGRPIAIPRRIAERNRTYRRLKQDMRVIGARCIVERDPVKRKMWDIEDEMEDEEEEENKRVRRE
jgi:hypothetical protein